MTPYTVIKNTSNEVLYIRRDDGASIPVCEDNTDYQRYLANVIENGEYLVEVIPDPEPPGPSLQDQIDAIVELML